MYPQTRVFDPITKAASFDLSQESPYLEIDTTAGVVQVNADDLAAVPGGYSAVYYFTKFAGGNKITLLCPTGWTTPAGLNTNLDLPGSTQGFLTWIVLYNAVRKTITILNTEFTPSVFPLGLFLPFAGTLTAAGLTDSFLANSSGSSVATIPLQYEVGVAWRHQQSIAHVTTNGLANGFDIYLVKSTVRVASVHVNAGATGRFVIANQVDFLDTDTLDVEIVGSAGGTSARMSVMVTGDYTTSP